MADFTSLSENEQRIIYESLQIDEYKKENTFLNEANIPSINVIFY